MNSIELKNLAGGAWAIAAMRRIRSYLETALSDVDGLVVIS